MESRVAVMVVPEDRILGRLAPLGMAAAAGTCLVVDLVERTTLPAAPTLEGLHESGVRRSHLTPGRSGVGLIARGELDLAPAVDLTREIVRHWPAAVLRVPASCGVDVGRPITIKAYVPEVEDRPTSRVVWQRLAFGQRPPGPSLPPIGRGRAWQMLRGTVNPRWRWVRAWAPIWRLA